MASAEDPDDPNGRELLKVSLVPADRTVVDGWQLWSPRPHTEQT
jgi:hypothetical protein